MEHVMNLAMSETKGKVQRGLQQEVEVKCSITPLIHNAIYWLPFGLHTAHVRREPRSLLLTVYFPLCKQQGRQLACTLTSPLSHELVSCT